MNFFHTPGSKEVIPFKEAKISIATHALHYGTAAFGGMRAIPTL